VRAATFLAIRADAKFCSHKCQLRGNRRGMAFRALIENISGNAGSLRNARRLFPPPDR
jgi:hypothetical protein